METEAVDPVKTFVFAALSARTAGTKSVQYDLIVQQIKKRDDPETIWKVIIAFSALSFQLVKGSHVFGDLMGQLFSYDWKGEDRLNEAMANLMVQLISHNATLIESVFSCLCYGLAVVEPPTSSESSQAIAQARYNHIHQAIQLVLEQVPMAFTSLFHNLKRLFPHKRFPIHQQIHFIQQLLHICEYTPRLQERIIDLIVNKCLEIDVEIVIDESGEVRIQRETSHTPNTTTADPDHLNTSIQEPEAMSVATDGNTSAVTDAPDDDLLSVTSNNNQQQAHEDAKLPKAVRDSAEKLDAMLSLLITLVDEREQKQTGPELFAALLRSFEHRLIHAHKSKFVQFALFYSAARNTANNTESEFKAQAAEEEVQRGEQLAKRMYKLSILDTQSAPTLVRQAALMYLASFLARANFLRPKFVHEMLKDLLKWCVAYVCHCKADFPCHANDELSGDWTKSKRKKLIKKHLSSLPVRHEYQQREELYTAQLLQQQQQQKSAATSADNLSLPSFTSSNKSKSSSSAFIDHIEFDEFGRMMIQEHRASQHEAFYAATQCLFYVLCFHGTDVALDLIAKNERKVMLNILVSSRLQPLRYCLQTVRWEFLRMAAYCQLLSVRTWQAFDRDLMLLSPSANGEDDGEEGEYSSCLLRFHSLMMEQDEDEYNDADHEDGFDYLQMADSRHSNKTDIDNDTETVASVTTKDTGRSSNNALSSGSTIMTSSTAVPGNGSHLALGPNTLESFFPFDPCYLRAVHTAIAPYYRQWDGVPGVPAHALMHVDVEDDEDEAEDDEDDEDDQDEEDEHEENGQEHEHGAFTPASSNAMSIVGSPPSQMLYPYHRSQEDRRERGESDMSTTDTFELHPSRSLLTQVLLQERDGVVHDDAISQVEEMPTRRPRQYSITSTGSW